MIDQPLIESTHAYLKRAGAFYGRSFRLDSIRADIRGKTAGYFRLQRNGHSLINYNAGLYRQHGDAFLKRTVPHEVAHLVAYQLFGGKIRPHGKEWQGVMQLFEADPGRCHDYDVSSTATRHYRRFSYRCECRQHSLTAIRHHRVLKGLVYLCRHCHQPLLPVVS